MTAVDSLAPLRRDENAVWSRFGSVIVSARSSVMHETYAYLDQVRRFVDMLGVGNVG